MGFWAEGVAGKIHLEIKSVSRMWSCGPATKPKGPKSLWVAAIMVEVKVYWTLVQQGLCLCHVAHLECLHSRSWPQSAPATWCSERF